MDRRARFEFGAEAFECSLSSRPWNPADDSIGGTRSSAAGIPAAYVVRRDALVEVVLRILESEWLPLLNLVIYGQSGASLLWFPDAAEPASFEVYLEAPAAGTRWSPARSSEYPRMFEATLTLRGVGAGVPFLAYFS